MGARLALVLLTSLSAALRYDGWTEHLGLHFKERCQETGGVHGMVFNLFAWAFGRMVPGKSNCESKEQLCGGAPLTGIQVRAAFGRLKGDDRDFYDFKLRCGTRWNYQWLGLRFEQLDQAQTDATVCPSGLVVTGIQVKRGRDEVSDRDYYNFALRCGGEWKNDVGQLPSESYRETRSATCPRGRPVDGLRVHRAFQDWGDLDTFEFQLHCGDTAMMPAPGANGRGAAPGGSTFGQRAEEQKRLMDEIREMRLKAEL